MTGDPRLSVAFRGSLGTFALDASFSVPARGVTALFGPSGCGKTSVLRCVAGLQRVREGFCSVAGDVWQGEGTLLPPHRRPVGYVFQEASLFPHLSVRGNLLFGAPRGPRAGAADRGLALDEVAALLGLAALLDRAPRHLSGGERQRVAIGRALLSRPKLLLMDEPLSALDRPARDEIIPFLERLVEALSIPTLYVTHDMAEVERLADHLVLMRAGRVEAAGPLSTLQSDPSLPLFASREAAVSLAAVVEAYDAVDGLATLRVEGGRCLVPTSALGVGETRRVCIAAGDVSLTREHPQRTTILNVLPARIVTSAPSGAFEVTVLLGLGTNGEGARVLARVTRRSWTALAFAEGDLVYAQVKGVALVPGRGHGGEATSNGTGRNCRWN